MSDGKPIDRLERLVTRMEAVTVQSERKLWLVDVVLVAFVGTCGLFMLAGFLAPLFFVLRSLPVP